MHAIAATPTANWPTRSFAAPAAGYLIRWSIRQVWWFRASYPFVPLLLGAAMATAAFCSPLACAQDQEALEEQVRSRVAEVTKVCVEQRAKIPGIVDLDKKLPGALRMSKDLFDDLDRLPNQDMHPTPEEIKTLIASRKVSLDCTNRLLELVRPVSPPTIIVATEVIAYISQGQILRLMTDDISYREINQARAKRSRSTKAELSEMSALLQNTGARTVAEALARYAKKAEDELMQFVDDYDRDLQAKKNKGYNNCEKVGVYEVCTK